MNNGFFKNKEINQHKDQEGFFSLKYAFMWYSPLKIILLHVHCLNTISIEKCKSDHNTDVEAGRRQATHINSQQQEYFKEIQATQ